METAEYHTLYNLETDYWWFRNLHDIILDALATSVAPGARVLDAGCGTGGLLGRLAARGYAAVGFDLSADAARFWPRRGVVGTACLGSINEIPFADNRFAATVSVDILEVDGVDDARAYGELVRVTQPGGLVVLVIPAYRWMMTAGHHQAVHAVRRYNRGTARALAAGQPVRVDRLTHAFAALFPIIGGVRLAHRLRERRGAVPVKSELQALPAPVNSLLYGLTNLERHALRRLDMPFGSSLVMIARKLDA